MASLSIRRLDDGIVALLRVRAARHGVSMEEEARQLLRAAVMADVEPIGSLATELFAGLGGDIDVPSREIAEPVTFR